MRPFSALLFSIDFSRMSLVSIVQTLWNGPGDFELSALSVTKLTRVCYFFHVEEWQTKTAINITLNSVCLLKKNQLH